MSQQGQRTISFVIPVLNGEKYIAECLKHIESEMQAGDEIIVVDNGSTDATHDIVAAHPRARLIEHPKVTIAGLRNRGAEASKGDVLAFIDSDCLLKPGWRAGVDKELSSDSVQVTGSTCDLPLQPTWVEQAWAPAIVKSSREVGYINSANLVIRRDAFVAVNGFNESLKTDEDYDIAFRMRRNGAKVIESPEIRAIHLGSAKTLRQFYQRQKRNATSIVDTWRLNGIDRPMIMTLVFIASLLLGAGSVVLAFVTGHWLLALGAVAILLAPLLTALNRVLRGTQVLQIPQMTVLFVVFYWVRTLTLIHHLRSSNRGSNS